MSQLGHKRKFKLTVPSCGWQVTNLTVNKLVWEMPYSANITEHEKELVEKGRKRMASSITVQ